jgi:uncharacterized membrane protein
MELGWTSRLWALACIAVIVAAAAARIAGAMNDLWLDEILALGTACHLSSATDIFANFHSELNHHLYTLYLFLFRPENNWFDCRIPSLAAGVGAVVVAGAIGRRRGRACGLFAMVLFGFSYVMILYSSEARGYALAVFFALAAFYLLDRYHETRRWPAAAGFSACVILGFLSQLTFVGFYLATFAWSLYCCKGETWRTFVRAMLCCHAAPLLFLAAFYAVDIRHVTGIGGTPSSLLRACIAVPAWAIGSPAHVAAQVAASFVAAAIFVVGIWPLRRERPDLCVFFLGAIVVFPLLLVAVRGSDVIYVRYFVVAIAFLLLLFSFALARLYERGPAGKAACAALLVLFVTMNSLHTASLFEHGRGRYSEAIRYIVEHSQRSPATVGGDQDFRVATVLAFYGLGDENARYCPRNSWPRRGPEWVICQKESFEDPTAEPMIVDERRNEYDLAKSFPSAPLSGLHWFLYHNRRP